MGTCISTRNNIRVSDMPSSGTEDKVLMEDCDNNTNEAKPPPSSTLSDESPGIQEKTENSEHESQNISCTARTNESLNDNSTENNEIDCIVRMRLEEFISDSSDSESSILEDGNMIWIPFSMAQHMGVTSGPRSLDTIGACLDTRDRIYANDEDLFMSVETSRRSSHLTSLSLPLSTKAVKSRPGHSFVTHLTQSKIEENINNNNFPIDDSSEIIETEIQNYDDNWISIKIDR